MHWVGFWEVADLRRLSYQSLCEEDDLSLMSQLLKDHCPQLRDLTFDNHHNLDHMVACFPTPATAHSTTTAVKEEYEKKRGVKTLQKLPPTLRKVWVFDHSLGSKPAEVVTRIHSGLPWPFIMPHWNPSKSMSSPLAPRDSSVFVQLPSFTTYRHQYH